VLVDAQSIGMRKGQVMEIADMGSWGWFFLCFLLRIVGIPLYRAKDFKLKRVNTRP